jgi:hypothetical protein
MSDLPRDFNLSIGLAIGLPARMGVHCDRTVASKGGCLQSWMGNRDLKMLFMRFNLAISLFLRTSTKA